MKNLNAELFDKLPNIICSECKNNTFKEVLLVKRVSSIISETGKTEILPYPILVCCNCNAPLEDIDSVEKEEKIKPSNIII